MPLKKYEISLESLASAFQQLWTISARFHFITVCLPLGICSQVKEKHRDATELEIYPLHTPGGCLHPDKDQIVDNPGIIWCPWCVSTCVNN
jgi:hypothetical protein